VTGATVRAGTAGGGECGAAAWLRWGTRSGLPGPACWGVTVRVPAAGGATPGCRGPAAREYSPKPAATTSASASATAQPRRRPANERPAPLAHAPQAGPARCRSGERAAAASPGPAGRAGRRRCGAWAEVASNSCRLTAASTCGGRQAASYSPGQRPGAGPDGPGDAADVPPRVEAAAAPAELAALDPPR